jgi:glycosyltransferase involved in cell wall biosynthesis
MRLRPDITISLLRREINFINDIKDGSRKIGELHVNRINYRTFDANDTNFVKKLFAKFWMQNLISKLKRLDTFIVLTEEDKQAWPELQNVIVIPDPLSFIPDQISSLMKRRVIAVGRYHYQKGFDLLLKAWKIVERQYTDWQLAIYGQGCKEPYERLAKELKIDLSRCNLNGPTPDIQKEYVNSSLFVFSSRYEGFGMVLVEAMACGLPVVSYACPCGPKDIVKDGEDGLLIEKENVDALAKGLMSLMCNDSLRRSMAMSAKENVMRFRMEHIAQQWRTVFELIKKE